MSDQKLGIEIEIETDDATRNVQRVESALESFSDEMKRAQAVTAKPITTKSNLLSSEATHNLRRTESAIGSFSGEVKRAQAMINKPVKAGILSREGAQVATASLGKSIFKAQLMVEVLKKIGSVALSAGQAVLRLGSSAATGTVHAGMMAESSRSAIQQLSHGGTAGGAAAQFDELRRMSEQLGLSVDGTVDSFKALLRMQFSPDAAKDIIRMGADLQAVGVNAEETQGVILTMSQIKAKGRLQSEELMQLQERGVSGELVQEALMTRLGMTDKVKYQKTLSAGGISSDVALAAIQDAIMKKTGETSLGQAGSKYAMTTSAGRLASLRAKAENAAIGIGDAMNPVVTQVIGAGSRLLDGLAESPSVRRLGGALLGGFEKLSGWIDREMPRIVATVEPVFDSIATGVELVTDGIDFLNENFDATNQMFKAAGFGLPKVFGLLAAIIGGVVLAIVGMNTAIGWVVTAVGGVISTVGQWVSSSYQWGENIVQGLIDGITSKVESLKTSVSGVWNTISTTFTGEAEIHSPSAATHRWGGHLGVGLASGVDASLGLVSAASARMAYAALPSWPANDTAPAFRVPGVVADIEAGQARASARASATGPTGNTVVVHLTVEAPKGGTREDGERYGAGVASGMERQLMGWLGGLAATGT